MKWVREWTKWMRWSEWMNKMKQMMKWMSERNGMELWFIYKCSVWVSNHILYHAHSPCFIGPRWIIEIVQCLPFCLCKVPRVGSSLSLSYITDTDTSWVDIDLFINTLHDSSLVTMWLVALIEIEESIGLDCAATLPHIVTWYVYYLLSLRSASMYRDTSPSSSMIEDSSARRMRTRLRAAL